MATQPETIEPVLCRHCLRKGSVALMRAMRAARPVLPERVRVSVRGIVGHAAVLSGIPIAHLMGPLRFQKFVRIRHAIALVALEYPYSTTMIGKAMGGRDHSTVINSRERGQALAERDSAFAWFVERLWAAAESAPLGPEDKPEPVPVRALAVEAEPQSASLPEPEPDSEPVVRSLPGEYRPRHALAEPRLVSHADKAPDEKRQLTQAQLSSAAFLAALRREHPERFVA